MKQKLVLLLMVGMITMLIGHPSVATAQETSPEELRDFLIEYAGAITACGQADCTGMEDLEEQLLELDEEGLQALYDSIPDIQCFMEAGMMVIDYCKPVVCTDEDEDGFSPEGGECGPVDCDPNDHTQYPGAEEVCNEEDDNCDGEIDEDCIPYERRPRWRLQAVDKMPLKDKNTSSSLYRLPYSPVAYPDPNDLPYAIYTSEIQLFGLLGKFPNTDLKNRANSSAVAGIHTGHEVLKAATITAQTICDMTPSPGNLATCGITGILGILLSYTEMILTEVEFHEDNIESAEIEAGYENGLRILHNTGEIFDRVEKHDKDINDRLDDIEKTLKTIGDRQLEIIRLLMTPQGQRQTDEPACDGEPCDWPIQKEKPTDSDSNENSPLNDQDNDNDGLTDSSDPNCLSLCGDGTCDWCEDCKNCSFDCKGQLNGKLGNRYCCGDGIQQSSEGNGMICNGNF
jgi:hypothetical protein